MSGQSPGGAMKETRSVGQVEGTVLEGARKIEEKSRQLDSMKIEFKADKEEDGTGEEALKEVTATDKSPEHSEHEGILTAQNYPDDVREYDADPLSTWSQSTGSVSYDSGWSLHSLIKNLTFNAKRADLQPMLPLMQTAKKQVISGISPSLVHIDEHMLAEMNRALRWRSQLGDMRTHIAISDRRPPNERRGIITKLLDDSLQEYLSSPSKEKRQICIRVECGGNEPPSLRITCAPGEREERCYSHMNERGVANIAGAEDGLQYPNYRSLSSMSLAYPSFASFSRCSITDHVRSVRRGRSPMHLLESATSSK